MLTEKSRKIIITGSAHAGTGFLVELLTELGLDTGRVSRAHQREPFDRCRADREHDVENVAAPYIVKNSALAAELPAVLARGHVTIDYALIPVRQLSARNSAPRATLENFHTLVETLAAHDIPCTFLHFPRFAHDADYSFEKLRPLLGEMARTEFDACFSRVAEPNSIRAILEGLPEDNADGAGKKSPDKPISSVGRHSRRLAAACVLTAFGWTAASWNSAKSVSVQESPTRELRTELLRFTPPLPSFRSPPMNLRHSLSLASLAPISSRTFHTRFGPMSMLDRPTPFGVPFQSEPFSHDFFRR